MKGSKVILFGISISVSCLAFSTMHVIAMLGGALGFIVGVIGLFMKDE